MTLSPIESRTNSLLHDHVRPAWDRAVSAWGRKDEVVRCSVERHPCQSRNVSATTGWRGTGLVLAIVFASPILARTHDLFTGSASTQSAYPATSARSAQTVVLPLWSQQSGPLPLPLRQLFRKSSKLRRGKDPGVPEIALRNSARLRSGWSGSCRSASRERKLPT